MLCFPSKDQWASHIGQQHGYSPEWRSRQCPLCLEDTGSGRISIVAHIGRHLEEIALAAVPQVPESEESEKWSVGSVRSVRSVGFEPEESLFRSAKRRTVFLDFCSCETDLERSTAKPSSNESLSLLPKGSQAEAFARLDKEGRRGFPCYCGRRYHRRDHLLRHMVWCKNAAIETYQCKRCGKVDLKLLMSDDTKD